MSDLFYKIYENLERLGPGSSEATFKAFSKVIINDGIGALDIGCGTGASTLLLTRLYPGRITALDNHQPFLDKLAAKADVLGLSSRIDLKCGDMNTLDFPANSFDLVWAEGSIYIMGFRNGLKKAAKVMKQGAFAAFTDMNFLRDDPPQPVRDLFRSECPEMVGHEENVKIINEEGFELVFSFLLDKSAHWENYYLPLEKSLNAFEQEFAKLPEAIQIAEEIRYEIDLYRHYSDYYGYYFYVMRWTG